MAYRGYSVANGFIVDQNGFGDFTTITAACAAAPSGTTIFIRAGTYTENFTLPVGVNLASFEGLFSNTIINGKITFSAVSGSSAISGLILQTNNDFCLVNSGQGQVGVFDCTFNMTNHTGISLTSTGIINVQNAGCDTGTTGIGLYNVTGGGTLFLKFFFSSNSGNTTTASTNSAGAVGIEFSAFNHPFSCTGTGNFIIGYMNTSTAATGATAITLNGSGAQTIEWVNINSGTGSALSIGGTASVLYTDIGSSNANAIAGTGTLHKAYLAFTQSSSTIAGTLTVTTFPTA